MIQHKKRYTALLGIGLASLLFYACEYDVKELGPKPTASFTVTPVAGAVNKYLLTSTSQNAFLYEWYKGSGAFVRTKAVDTVYFPDKGDYTVKLRVYGESGMDSTAQVIKVAADDPAAMTPMKALTGNSSRTWVLMPAAGALRVGPDNSTTWWANGTADVTAGDRTCLFNDEYTFSTNGTFVMNDKGDMRVDDESGAAWPTDIGLAIGCYPMSQIPTKYKPWGSGNFTFSIIGNNKLRVMGLGAHLGLYKAGDEGTIAEPESANTYDIIELTPTKLVVKKIYSWGQWQFTFVPKP